MFYKRLFLIANCFIVVSTAKLFSTEEIQSVSISPQIAQFESFTGKITGSKVRMRAGPTREGYVVRETTQGDILGIVGEENEFYAVVPPKGMKGYVFRTFILDDVVEGERVNVRLAPDTDAPIIAQLSSGDRVKATVSEKNNKWLEIELPKTCHFFVAKEYVEKTGGFELLAEIEKKKVEAVQLLNSAFLFAKAEIMKSFEEIDLDAITQKLEDLIKNYADFSDISGKAAEINALIHDIYVQKKIAFLESKSNKTTTSEMDSSLMEKLAKLGIDLRATKEAALEKARHEEKSVAKVGEAASNVVGMSAPLSDKEMTDKMLLWQPLEESIYQLWAAANEQRKMEEFYEEEELNATILTGIVESYNRPVKSKPGDYILRSENFPVAFLYSTKVNLDNYTGKKVTLLASPRPNNNFAFPAYFVLSVE